MPVASDVTFIADVINNKATIVTSVPSNPNEGTLIMFLGTDSNFKTGGLYKYTNSSWVQLFAVTKADVGLGNCDNTADADKNVLYAQSAGYCSSATSADITKTLDTTNGDKLQIGNGTSVNVTNAAHASVADTATNATNATNATSVATAVTATTATACTGNSTVINASSTQNCAADSRFIVTSNVTLTLGTDSTVGCIAEIFAVTACTVAYNSNTLSLLAGTRAMFIFYNNSWEYFDAHGLSII